MPRFAFTFLFLLMSAFTPLPANAQGKVTVDGFDVTVSATYALTGSVTPHVRDAFARVLATQYNGSTYAYKCYTVHFDLRLRRDGETIRAGDFVFDVLDVSSSEAIREAFEASALYDLNDWATYDAETGNLREAECSNYDNGYIPECAYVSHWFYNTQDDTHHANAYVRWPEGVSAPAEQWRRNWGADYNGNIAAKTGRLTTASNDKTIAHEIGHTLGFRHTTSLHDLMSGRGSDIKDAIIFTNLYQMLREMRLECRWSMEFPDPTFSVANAWTCPADCISGHDGQWSHAFTVQSRGQALEGEGVLDYEMFRESGCNFRTATRPGKYAVSGKLVDSIDRGKPSDGADLGYIMDLNFDYRKLPPVFVAAEVPEYTPGWMNLVSANNIFLPMKGPGPKDIQNPPRLWTDTSEQPTQCLMTFYKADSGQLEITDVEPFRESQLAAQLDTCETYLSPERHGLSCE